MNRLNRFALSALLIALLSTTNMYAQIVFDGSPGTSAPPATLGPFTMMSFPTDTRADFTNVTTVPGPNGDITFSDATGVSTVGVTWATWSHGYNGKVYFRAGQSITLTMPANTVAFYFYAQPNNFATFTVTATAQDNTTSGPINVVGNSGASYFGFYSTNGVPLVSIQVDVQTGSNGFAIGEFGIFQCSSPALTVSVTPSMLWPPNHKMATINATVTATGDCGNLSVTLESVTSNEPDNGVDDGNTINDIQDAMVGTPDYQFKVRRERSGSGTGRIYTATYKVVDGAGFSVTESATITVPLSLGKNDATAVAVPGIIELEQNYPNPFNPSTTIAYSVPEDGHVTLAVFDLMGREIITLVNEEHMSGRYSVSFDAANQPSGTYIYRLTMGDQTMMRTMTLSK